MLRAANASRVPDRSSVRAIDRLFLRQDLPLRGTTLPVHSSRKLHWQSVNRRLAKWLAAFGSTRPMGVGNGGSSATGRADRHGSPARLRTPAHRALLSRGAHDL